MKVYGKKQDAKRVSTKGAAGVSRFKHMPGLFVSLCLASCGGSPASWDDPGEPAAVFQEFNNNLVAFVGCSQPQKDKLLLAGSFLTTRISETDGAGVPRLRTCLNESFMGKDSDAVFYALNNNTATTIRCVNVFSSTCGPDANTNFSGCASWAPAGTDDVSLSIQFLNNPATTTAQIAAVMAHEIMHNRGYSHEDDAFTPGFDSSVPVRVGRCIETSNNIPAAESRTRGFTSKSTIELEVLNEHGWTQGVTNPTKYSAREIGCTSSFVNGLQIGLTRHAATPRTAEWSDVGALGVVCEGGGSGSEVIGDATAGLTTSACPSGQVLVGVSGSLYLGKLSAICAPISNTNSQTVLSAVQGNNVGNLNNAVSRVCPLGMAVRTIGLTGGGSGFGYGASDIRLTCDFPRTSFDGGTATTTWGNKFGLNSISRRSRCAWGGAMNAVIGRAGVYIDRIGGTCQSIKTITGPLTSPYPLVPFVGGAGGTHFNLSCPAGKLVVGMTVAGGSFIDSVSPLCRSLGSTATPVPAGFAGGGGGTPKTMVCPLGGYVTGLNTWEEGGLVVGLEAVCGRFQTK
ncbi:MAG: hypothetical protein SFV15_03350 [Polyangiaceae bacterium]|nr:hypothetical protein [Polyangiaceae bacterium]